MNMKISVSSYSFQQYIRAGKMTQFDCVAKAKELGFDAIEFIVLDGENLEEQKEHARKLRKFIRLEYFYFTKQKWYTLKRHNKIYHDGFYRVKNPILRLFIRDKGELNYESNNL